MEPLKLLSEVLGWTYFISWTLSFYPQVIVNYKLKHVRGLSFDFLLLNIIGFASYSTFTVFMYFHEGIRALYRQENKGSDNLVHLTDVLFAVHAFFITAITCAQAIYYREGQKVKTIVSLFSFGIFLLVVVLFALILFKVCFSWLDLINTFGRIKIVLTFMKYCPQAYRNYKRKSTHGWAIGMVLLDFVGGVCSSIQLVVDAARDNNWGGIVGDLPKFLLGIISLAFDIIFMIQHYCLYKERHDPDAEIPEKVFDIEIQNKNMTEKLPVYSKD